MRCVCGFVSSSAKVFVYMESELVANILFGTFALAWFVVRWFYYSKNILYSVYVYAWADLVQPAIAQGELFGMDAGTWYKLYLAFFGFLALLLVLHIYWGVLIVRMVVKALGDGNVEKDIRSDSEDESAKIEDESMAKIASADAANGGGGLKAKRRRAPKAE